MRKQGGVFVGETRLAGHEVPVEVQGRSRRAGAERADGRRRPRLPARSRSRSALYGIGASLYGARTRPPRVGRLRPARGVRAGGRPDASPSRCSRSRSCATTSRFNIVADTLEHDHADVLQGRRGVVLAGRLAAAVGVAAVAVVEPRAVPRRAGGCARSRPTRPRCCSASARFFVCADGLLRQPVRDDSPGAGRGRGPRTRCCATRAMMIHPPMLYSGYTLCTIPFAFAIGALLARRVDAEWIRVDAPLRARRLAVPRHRASCSARAGPTPSSAGAATGAGTRSRTPR